ncbi:MAG: hypothetical protein JXN63_09240 [Candidatus Delongbacteria bacterium]|nr:hypothetical protein [Candidatus Delongbacteria bacterium]
MKIITFALFIVSFLLQAETEVTRTVTEYSLKKSDGDSWSVLRFGRNDDFSPFGYMKYSKSARIESLEDECKLIDELWSHADESVNIELTTADVGYPLQYPDIMPDYIQAFLDSEEWMTHVSLKGRELNYDLMHKVIYENDIFSALTDLFYLHGYYITGVSTEKHGFVPKEDLIKYGFKGEEVIPIPFMLYWRVERVKKVK